MALVLVCVTLLDENDNSPTFSRNTYEGKVFANQTMGMLLVQVSHQLSSVQPNASTAGGLVQPGPVQAGSVQFSPGQSCFFLVSSFHSG